MSGTQLVQYDAMIRAIDVCHKVDELKELHNKALALELYAKVAMNIDAERKAAEIRLRAERKAGELLAKMKKSSSKETATKGGHAKAGTVPPAAVAESSVYRQAIESAGIKERTARRWQELAGGNAETGT